MCAFSVFVLRGLILALAVSCDFLWLHGHRKNGRINGLSRTTIHPNAFRATAITAITALLPLPLLYGVITRGDL